VKRDHGGPLSTGIVGKLSQIAYRLLILVVGSLPLSASYALAEWIVRLLAFLVPKTKRRVEENLNGVFGDEKTPAEYKKLARENMIIAWGLKEVDWAGVRHFDRNYIEKHVKLLGLELLEEALAKGKGVLLISFHHGSPSILYVSLLPFLGHPPLIPARRVFDERTSQKQIDIFQHHGASAVYSDYSYRAMLTQLREGKIVALLGDHLTSPAGIRVRYFGRETLMPSGPAMLAYQRRPAVLPCCVIRNGKYDYVAEFGDPIDIPPTPKTITDEDLKLVASQYISFFEDSIRKHPTQWETFFPAWPKSFEEEDLQEFWTAFGVVKRL